MEKNHRKLPHRGNDSCFACSQNNPSGLKMQFFTDGSKVFSQPRVPVHLSGWDHMVHGGIITTMLDEIMGWSALHLLKKMTLTKSITVEFLKPVYVEEDLKLEGSLLELKSEREAVMQSFLYNHKDQLCAKATGIFALFTPEAMRKRGIIDSQILKGIEKIILDKEP